MKLTDEIVENAQPTDRPYKKADGKGMYILINPNGAKYWRWKYRFHGKEKNFCIGVYPNVTTIQARRICDDARAILKNGADPMSIRHAEKKNRDKSSQNQNQFDLSMSDKGELTIETATRLLHLSALQTEALRSFMIATPTPDANGGGYEAY